MQKILPLKIRIRKLEFAQYYSRNVSIVEKHDPERLQINAAFINAKNALPLAGELKVLTRKYPMTKEQNAVLEKIRTSVSTLNQFVKTMERKPNEAHAQEALILFDYVKRHLGGFRKTNTNEQFVLFSRMIEGLEQDAVLVQAVETVGLTLTVERLKELRTEYETVYDARRKALADKAKARTREIRDELNILLRQLFSSIELVALEHPELDYSPLVRELNTETELQNASRRPRQAGSEDNETINITPATEELDSAV